METLLEFDQARGHTACLWQRDVESGANQRIRHLSGDIVVESGKLLPAYCLHEAGPLSPSLEIRSSRVARHGTQDTPIKATLIVR